MAATTHCPLLGVPVGARSIHALVKDAVAAVGRGGERVIFACANPHSLVVAQSDPVFRQALLSATHIVADGVGVTVATRLAAGVSLPRVTGSDVFLGVLRALEHAGGCRVFFLGSTRETL